MVWYHIWYHETVWYHTRFSLSCQKKKWYCIWYHIKCWHFSYEIVENIKNYWYHWQFTWIFACYSMFLRMISRTFDILAIWYHLCSMISLPPGRRDGAGWGRHAPAAPPPPASPSPTYCWRVWSWTETVLIPRLDLLQLWLRA